jgi:hypothetical protein
VSTDIRSARVALAPTGVKILHAVVLALPLVSSLACGSSLNGHDGGAGTTGSGGWAGTGGSAGTGESPVRPPPTCLRDLIATCALGAPCQYSNGDAGRRVCYAGGETLSVVSVTAADCNLGGQGENRNITEIRKADGTLCYSAEASCFCGQACEIQTFIWRNGAGQVVARGGSDSRGNTTITCEGTGETCTGPFDWSTGQYSCQPHLSDQCTLGTCP